MSGDAPRPFGLDRTADGVALRGEVDLDCLPTLLGTFDHAIDHSTGPFVIDLSDVDFLDSSGLSALMHARTLLQRDERALTVICPPGPVRRMLDLTGVAGLLFAEPR